MSCFMRCSWCGGPFNGGNCRCCTNVSFRDEFFRNPDPISYDETPDFSCPPPQPQYETYSCELCGNDSYYGFDCPPWFPLVYEPEPSYNQNFGDNYYLQNSLSFPQQYLCCETQSTNVSTHTPVPSRHFNIIYDYDDDDEENTIPLNDITSQIPLSIAITPVLPTLEPEDSLIMGDEDLSTIPEKESDEVINSSVEDLVPIPSKSEDTSGSDSECDLPSCNDFSPINVSEEKFVTFSNPLFDSNDDFTSSDDESISDEDVPEDNDIESEDSYVSKLDEPDLLVTPISKLNEDECFNPGGDIDEIELLL
ncbi:hypothetical protein Tco_0484612 [Tanacetum coccineum]